MFDFAAMQKFCACFYLSLPFKIDSPIYNMKFFSSDYWVHGTQNNQLEPSVSTQKSVLEYAPGPKILSKPWQKSGSQSKPAYFLDILANILGPSAYFLK